MYTLLLVDDEEDVIEVIERKVSWEQIGNTACIAMGEK